MSKLSDRLEKLEVQKDEAARSGVLIIFSTDGRCRVGDMEYASEDEAKAAHPSEMYVFLPENGRER